MGNIELYVTDLTRRKTAPVSKLHKFSLYFNGRRTEMYRAKFNEYVVRCNNSDDVQAQLKEFNGVTNMQLNGMPVSTIEEIKLITILVR